MPLVFRYSVKEYADYLFFYYLLQNGGGEEVVAQILKDTVPKGTKRAIMESPNYEENHAEYSVWNWNADPIQRYKDDPGFPAIGITGTALKPDKIDIPGTRQVSLWLSAGAAEYRFFEVAQDTGIKRIVFSFPDKDNKKQQRRALVKINGVWTEEFWNSVKEKTFCADRPGDKVQAVILIYSNSDLEADYISSYSIDSEGECPFEVTGRTTQTWTLSTNLPGSTATESGTFISDDEIEYSEDEGAYVIKKRTMSCHESGSGHTDMELAEGVRVTITTSSSASGENVEEYSGDDELPIKISFEEENEIVNFIVSPGHLKNTQWVRDVITENGKTHTEMRGCGGAGTANVLEFPYDSEYYSESNGVRRVHGTKQVSGPGLTGTLEFDYTLVEKPPE